ncbi:MAG TPA: PAS domain S-box protein [Candidatus Dormibacteraeota bacterium]|nr:PAS domain S-box protein [Candidatus Dormibacteraeota bacterium]
MAGEALGSDLLRSSVFEALPDGIVIADLEGRIINVNQQLAELSGYAPAELVGQLVETLVPDSLRAQHPHHRASYIEAGLPTRPMGANLRIRLLTKTGNEVPVDISLRRLELGRGTYVLAAVRDATDRNRQQARTEAMLEVSQMILQGHDTNEILGLIARRARELVGASLAMVNIPAPGGDELVVQVADGYAEDRLRGQRVPVDHSLDGEVLRSRESLVVKDVAADARSASDAVRPIGRGASIVVPLRVGGSVFGSLSVSNLKGERTFGSDDLTVVELIASQASVAMEYGRVRDQLSRLALVEDRERIGRELHDGVIQSLFAVGMNLETSAAIAGPGDLQDRLQRAVAELDRAIRDLRNYIFGLRPGILADRQLSQAIADLATDTADKSGIVTVVDVDPVVALGLSPRAGDVVQLVRESLSNVARHSRAATCRVSLHREGDEAVLVIEDDGVGFNPSPAGTGQGLANLRSRAERLSGTLSVEPAEGQGTRVEVRLPL